jgi:hypothetical protein
MSERHAKGTGGLQRLVRAYLARRYTILFYSLLLTLGAAPLLAALHLDDRLLQLFLALNLLAAALGVGDRRPSSFFLLLVGAALMVRLAAVPLHAEALATTSLALWTVVGLLAAAGTVRFAMQGTAVSGEHLYAALSAYLLAGVFFGVLYWVIERAWTGSFALAGATVAPGGFSPASAIYFSFVTQATLGYGDVVPASEVARGLAIVQAVAGQLYLAVMVARLVSLYVRDPQKGEGS